MRRHPGGDQRLAVDLYPRSGAGTGVRPVVRKGSAGDRSEGTSAGHKLVVDFDADGFKAGFRLQFCPSAGPGERARCVKCSYIMTDSPIAVQLI